MPQTNARRVARFWPAIAVSGILCVAEIVLLRNEQARHWAAWISRWVAFSTALVWLPCVVYFLYKIARVPDQRYKWGRRVGYFGVAVLACQVALMSVQAMQSARATRLIASVEAYKHAHGRCPFSLEQMGLKNERVNGQAVGIDGISYNDGSVFYPGPLPFSMNIYECSTGKWSYFVD